ncbi:transporter substrate-binding domain-containing protein [Zunongwangia sp. HRR-M8]|uniref:transporter substrate-binding domain-containing protein n=1 Tax=Zunongwangia sp. HRR-M8 TaxID=3015170 RepID=UPI0022DCF8D3|nr:transporter substrate-binding domain-containing protein [Zunongwangia sp. HRR-M8]WBL23905.1 transporter substrate-binding domain-containing protein [Zunongwangia sp. HRR-M8]
MKYYLVLFSLFLTTITSAKTFQDSTKSTPEVYKIGVQLTAPFVTQKPNGNFDGLSIKSWNLVNENLDYNFEYKTYESLAALLNAVESGEVDFSINPITVTDNRMERMDFSQPYFISHTGVAKKKESQVFNILKNLWSWEFISAILALLGTIFIFGFLVWIFERKKNAEEFGGGKGRGLLEGFWWSAVTMTTVGYGDKSPRTTGGRIVGLIWMFMAIIIISSLTASIASSLTVKSINDEISGISDLNRFNVGTVVSSSAAELLDLYNVKSEKLNSVSDGIELIQNDDLDLLVYDEPILRYTIEQMEVGKDIEVLEQTLKKDYYSYAFPKNSDLVKIINPALVRMLKSMEWENLIKEYK